MATNPNPHARHRQRVREEFMANGFNDATPPHKVMEMLLFYSIPREDTNETAHALLDHFGSISAILDATPEELKRINGIGDNSATMLKLIAHICQRYQSDKFKKGYRHGSMDNLCKFLEKKHFGFTKEFFSVTSLNSRGEIIAFDMISKGDVTSVGITTRSVVEVVIERKAVAAVICHNHPSGNAMPSADDIKMTNRVAKALRHINIPLLDHVIVIDNDYVSLAQSEAFNKLFEKSAQD